MPSQVKPPQPGLQSLQNLSPSNKSIVLQDRSGLPKHYACNDPTLAYVRNLLEAGGLPDTGPSFGFGQQQIPAIQGGYGQQGSIGSLPSAGSHYSSSGSIGSQASQSNVFGPVAR